MKTPPKVSASATFRHRWEETLSMSEGQPVQRCMNCRTERIPDAATKSLYLYRRGAAMPPSGKPLGEEWSAFKAGVVPKCLSMELLP